MMSDPDHKGDEFHYKAPQPNRHEFLPGETVYSLPRLESIDLGGYQRKNVSNVDWHEHGRSYFDMGLRLLLSYQHEMAAKCFLACLKFSPYTAMAHGLVALCHSPNYNFKGRAYYESACHHDEIDKDDALCMFPSQQVADRHSSLALQVIEQVKKLTKTSRQNNNHLQKKKNNSKGKCKSPQKPLPQSSHEQNEQLPQQQQDMKPDLISDVEVQLLQAIRILTCHPGIDADLAQEFVGRPYADALRKVYQRYPKDPEVAYFFAESIVVLNAWQLYEYPSGKPVSPDVDEVKRVLETALEQHHHRHAGLCHMYVHLSEMSATPGQALKACSALRTEFPQAGHLIHMPTHIDVLLGDYKSCVQYNLKAIQADAHMWKHSPSTAGKESFYFGYIVHNYHMAVYGAILGAMERQARMCAAELNGILTEKWFSELPDLASYLESYSALDLHVLVRFGKWQEILDLPLPQDSKLMLYRTASIYYARGLAFANTGRLDEANEALVSLDRVRGDPEAHFRILHNNSVADLLAVDSVMLKGEITYHQGNFSRAFKLLRRAVFLQDSLKYDEPWGKMQPIRHALGGLLLEQGNVDEAEQVFRRDLQFHPKNPWALVGLIACLERKSCGCCGGGVDDLVQKNDDDFNKGSNSNELEELKTLLKLHQELEWTDYHVVVPCECCRHPE